MLRRKLVSVTLVSFLWIYFFCYIANVSLFPRSESVLELDLSIASTLSSKFEDLERHALSEEVIERTLRALNNDENISLSAYKKYIPLTSQELRDNIQVTKKANSYFLYVTNPNENIALLIVQKLGESLVEILELDNLDLRNQQLSILNEQLTDTEVQVEAAEEEIEILNTKMLVSEKNSLIREYQKLSKVFGPRHPKMLELAKEISVFANEEFSHLELLGFNVYDVGSASILENKKQVLEETILNLEREKASLQESINQIEKNDIASIILRNPRLSAANYQNAIWFKSLKQTFIIVLCLMVLYSLLLYMRPNLRSKQDVVDELGIDNVFVFPKLKSGLHPGKASEQKTKLIPEITVISGNADEKSLTTLNNNLPSTHVKNPALSGEQKDLEVLATELMISARDHHQRVFLFSSSMPQEGNSTIVANLAIAFSKYDKNVLLVDADFNSPGLYSNFDLKSGLRGLSNYIASGKALNDFVYDTCFPGLSILPIGTEQEEASHLLSSQKLKRAINRAAYEYSFVLIDAGSLLSTASAAFVANSVGAVYLVVDSKTTEKELVKKALARLDRIKVKTEGVILNKA